MDPPRGLNQQHESPLEISEKPRIAARATESELKSLRRKISVP